MIYLVNIFLTIFICVQGNLMYDNISVVASNNNMNLLLVIYIMISSIIFTYKTLIIYRIIPNKYIKYFIYLTGIIMFVGSLFPYRFNGVDLFSKIHVNCSMIGCVSFLVLLFIYTRLLCIYHYNIYLKVHWIYDFCIQVLIICFLFFSRVNGYLEILYSLIVCFYLHKLEIEIKKTT